MRGQRIINSFAASEDNAVDSTDEDNFYKVLNDKANVAKVGASKGRDAVNSESLSKKWLI